ncbi:MAG: quinone-dependent dihydroorotate dehydrogenase [Rikenellaceae bacterium]|nr:quinone-dependent dihydroorotate dehydrogenase [Rikenellaceae bacterium]
MYKSIIRPILFLMSPERVHGLTAWILRAAGRVGLRGVIAPVFTYRDKSLERDVFGVRFRNPVGLAAGFDKDGRLYRDLGAFGFGFIEVGTVTPQPQPGNPKPRLFRLKQDGALINRMGFNNHGVEAMVRNLRRRRKGLVIGGNLGKNTLTPNEQAPADYLRMFRSLYQYVDYFVINVSCPNVKDVTALQNTANLMAILQPLFDFRRGQNEYRPILVKISPDLPRGHVDDIVKVLVDTQLDGLVAVNTTTSREGLATPSAKVEAMGAGGLSGSPLTERSIEMVRYLHEKTEGRYPIIGVGGIMTPEDAQRMLDAGASLVQVYTGFIYEGPSLVKRICRHIAGKRS